MQKSLGAFLRNTVLLLALLGTSQAHAQLVSGRDFVPLKAPQPSQDAAKIEIVEFFWYGCPHCNALQPALGAWLKRKPADVVFRRQPAAFDDSWLQLARTYYAMESLGVADRLHHPLFAAIHNQRTLDPRVLLRDTRPIFDWVAAQGVDRQKFTDAYNSFAVSSRAQGTIALTDRHDVTGTPALVVDGRYLTAPSMVLKADKSVDYDRYFRIVDQLVVMARKDHGKK
jgi:thiol:disulfide interchange protein DsbA